MVNENGSSKLNVVARLGEDGKLKVVPPKSENASSFMRLDKQGDVLDNFMANFVRQYKEPTHFGFFKVSANQIQNTSAEMQKMLKDPNSPSNKSKIINWANYDLVVNDVSRDLFDINLITYSLYN